MSTIELDGHVWTIPAARYKTGTDHVIALSPAARKLVEGQIPAKPRKNLQFVFSTTHGEKPFAGFSKCKAALDDAIADIREKAGRPPMEGWVLHDLRRTARTLMSRAGVSADHAERCLGHVIAGVRGVYDRYAFLEEKRVAFEALATMVDTILDPPQDNVVPLRR